MSGFFLRLSHRQFDLLHPEHLSQAHLSDLQHSNPETGTRRKRMKMKIRNQSKPCIFSLKLVFFFWCLSPFRYWKWKLFLRCIERTKQKSWNPQTTLNFLAQYEYVEDFETPQQERYKYQDRCLFSSTWSLTFDENLELLDPLLLSSVIQLYNPWA